MDARVDLGLVCQRSAEPVSDGGVKELAEDWEYQHEMRVWETKMAREAQIFGAQMAAVVGFASLAIKSIILANSASAGAVLAFLATMWGKPAAQKVAGPALDSVETFAWGILAAMVAAAISYITQSLYAWHDIVAEEWAGRIWFIQIKKSGLARIGIGFHLLAIVAAAAGVASFAIGAMDGLEALGAANGGAMAEPLLEFSTSASPAGDA